MFAVTGGCGAAHGRRRGEGLLAADEFLVFVFVFVFVFVVFVFVFVFLVFVLVFVVFIFVFVVLSLSMLCSTSPPGGNQVDGLTPV